MKIFLTLLAITLSLTSVSVKSDVKEKTALYFNSGEFQKQLYQLGVYWDRNVLKIKTNCTSKYHVNPVSHSFIKPLKFNAEGIYPTEGVWTFRYSFSRCDETIIYNALVIAQGGKQPKMVTLAPGTTKTSPQLLRDLYIGGVSMMVAKKSENKDCKKTNILNTSVSLEPTTLELNGKKIKGVWEEFWTVKHCDEQIDMSFCLIPDGKGGTSWVGGKCTNKALKSNKGI